MVLVDCLDDDLATPISCRYKVIRVAALVLSPRLITTASTVSSPRLMRFSFLVASAITGLRVKSLIFCTRSLSRSMAMVFCLSSLSVLTTQDPKFPRPITANVFAMRSPKGQPIRMFSSA